MHFAVMIENLAVKTCKKFCQAPSRLAISSSVSQNAISSRKVRYFISMKEKDYVRK